MSAEGPTGQGSVWTERYSDAARVARATLQARDGDVACRRWRRAPTAGTLRCPCQAAVTQAGLQVVWSELELGAAGRQNR